MTAYGKAIPYRKLIELNRDFADVKDNKMRWINHNGKLCLTQVMNHDMWKQTSW